MRLDLPPGSSLHDALFRHGVEFPCGGAGTCGGCRVRVLEGGIAITPEMRDVLTLAQLEAGWRLACCARAEGPVTLEIEQWSTAILSDDAPLACTPAEGRGIAIDLGTTTLVAQLIDLSTGAVLAVQTARNPQALHGADVMSRIEFALNGGAVKLASLIRDELGAMIAGMPGANTVLIAGNTAMHHLFCGIDVAPLARVPFDPVDDGERTFAARDLGWPLDAAVRFLPCLGGFVGSDVAAGILATQLAASGRLAALVDLGTNGEIVAGSRERLLCASTAAGPAFEAGRIRMGMTASSGAVSHVALRDGTVDVRTIDGAPARGICGSGVVAAAAAGLDLGVIRPNGRMPRDFELAPGVALTQSDIRELQLAKGAIAAGLRILVKRLGATLDDLETVYLAGAFGNYVDVRSARRIGLLEVDPAVVVPAGNTALRGTKMALAGAPFRTAAVEHVPLAADPEFQDTFVDCIPFNAGR